MSGAILEPSVVLLGAFALALALLASVTGCGAPPPPADACEGSTDACCAVDAAADACSAQCGFSRVHHDGYAAGCGETVDEATGQPGQTSATDVKDDRA